MKKFIIYCLLLVSVVPLAFDKGVFAPSAGESFVFMTLVVVAVVATTVGYITDHSFRTSMVEGVLRLRKHSIAIFLGVFTAIFGISTLFAFDRYGALWGNVDRNGGFAVLLFLFVFFFLTSLLFEKKEWYIFFKITLLVSLVVLIKEYAQVAAGIDRPYSLIGNPSFLAGYLLFTLFCSIVVFGDTRRLLWKLLSVLMFVGSIGGIVLSQTRGTMLGLGIGLFISFLFAAFRGKAMYVGRMQVRLLAIISLSLIGLFSIIYFSTRTSNFWQSIPGFSRATLVQNKDIATIKSREIVWKISLHSLSPSQEGIKKLLIGWGPENFVLAFSKHYDPGIYSYDPTIFDRSHNKLVDILVTTGILGLLAYGGLWVSFARSISRIKSFWPTAGALFFSIAYLIHLMFLFDAPVTWIAFYAVLSFMILFSDVKAPPPATARSVSNATMIGLVLFSGFLLFAFVDNFFPGYMGMRRYVSLVSGHTATDAVTKIDRIFKHHTYAEGNTINNFLDSAANGYNQHRNDVQLTLLNKAIDVGTAYLAWRPKDYRIGVQLADALNAKGDTQSLQESQADVRTLISWNPLYPGYHYLLALSLAYQKKYDAAIAEVSDLIHSGVHVTKDYYYYGTVLYLAGPTHYQEALDAFETAFNETPSLFSNNVQGNEHAYLAFLQFFYHTRNKDTINRIANRLIENNYSNSSSLQSLLQYINKNVWPVVEFN